mgnify:FL=1
MDDQSIVALFWERSEQAIAETDRKYGAYCYSIAYHALANNEDAEESVSDTYMAAWNRLPPHRPSVLATFLGKITRRISINRWKAKNTAKRGGGQITLALEELDNCVDGTQDIEANSDARELSACLNRFLDSLPKVERDIFLRRYWFFDPIAAIAESYGFTQSKVASMLHRMRGKLRKQLEKEGFV